MNSKDKISGAIYERNYVYNFHFHLVWCTKYRKPVFTNSQLVEEMEVMPDHVHLLVSFKPKYSASNVVKALKGASARLFFQNHPEIKNNKLWGGHLWSHSYYMGTLGNMSKETVEKYIQNQYRNSSPD